MEEFRICSEEKMLSWWLRRGRKLDVGRPGKKGVEELLICGCAPEQFRPLTMTGSIRGPCSLINAHFKMVPPLSSGGHSWGVATGLTQLAHLKEVKQCTHPLLSACPGCLALEGIHYLLLQLECSRQAVGMMGPARSRSRCVHRHLTVALPLTLSSKPALLTSKPGICHSIFVIQVSTDWLRPQDTLRRFWKGSIITGVRKQEIHVGWRPERQICGYGKSTRRVDMSRRVIKISFKSRERSEVET